MGNDMAGLAERLSTEFDSLPATTVIRVVTDRVDQWPDADVHFIEQAARTELSAGPPRTSVPLRKAQHSAASARQ